MNMSLPLERKNEKQKLRFFFNKLVFYQDSTRTGSRKALVLRTSIPEISGTLQQTALFLAHLVHHVTSRSRNIQFMRLTAGINIKTLQDASDTHVTSLGQTGTLYNTHDQNMVGPNVVSCCCCSCCVLKHQQY